ncbi:MAG: 50S ribosomal protein L9 [Vicingaceae bacterium]
MEIILKEDIANLGFKDEIVNVKPGYGRNYLIPKGLAVQATPATKKMLQETLKQRAKKEQTAIDEANKIINKLKETNIQVPAKTGEKGKLFGSIGSINLAEALQKAGFDIDKKYIKVKGEPIKALGKYEADIRLHREVSGTINFEVVADK